MISQASEFVVRKRSQSRMRVAVRLLFLLTLLVVCLSGCATRRLLKKQKLQVLTDEFKYMSDVDQLLTGTPNPEVLSQTSVFISKKTIDQVLSAADNIEIPIAQIKGATFHVDSVRSDFRDNFPILNIKCWAEKKSLKLRVDLSVYAEIEPVLSSKDPSKLLLKVNVIKVVPDVRIGFLKFQLWWFVRDLIHAKLNNFVDGLPEFSVPLRSGFAFNAPPKTQPMRITSDDGYVDGNLDLPGYSVNGALTLDRVLFLRDGMHVFVSTNLATK